MKYQKVVIGIDPSYANTGISIACDGKLQKVTSVRLSKLAKNNTERREVLNKVLNKLVLQAMHRANEVELIIERVRLHKGQVINIQYIKSVAALTSVVVDVAVKNDVHLYSVDTRCWKSQVVGTIKRQSNPYGVPEEKYPTVEWCIKQGFEQSILVQASEKKKVGCFTKSGIKYEYNNDAADSAAIAMFGFRGKRSMLKEERF